MKFGVLSKIPKEQLSKKGAIPEWIDALLEPLNQFIEKVGTALQGNLDFENNFLCQVKSQKFSHSSEVIVGLDKKFKVLGVVVLNSGGLGVDVFKWRDIGNGTLGVTFNFSSGTEAMCTLLILFRGG